MLATQTWWLHPEILLVSGQQMWPEFSGSAQHTGWAAPRFLSSRPAPFSLLGTPRLEGQEERSVAPPAQLSQLAPRTMFRFHLSFHELDRGTKTSSTKLGEREAHFQSTGNNTNKHDVT